MLVAGSPCSHPQAQDSENNLLVAHLPHLVADLCAGGIPEVPRTDVVCGRRASNPLGARTRGEGAAVGQDAFCVLVHATVARSGTRGRRQPSTSPATGNCLIRSHLWTYTVYPDSNTGRARGKCVSTHSVAKKINNITDDGSRLKPTQTGATSPRQPPPVPNRLVPRRAGYPRRRLAFWGWWSATADHRS